MQPVPPPQSHWPPATLDALGALELPPALLVAGAIARKGGHAAEAVPPGGHAAGALVTGAVLPAHENDAVADVLLDRADVLVAGLLTDLFTATLAPFAAAGAALLPGLAALAVGIEGSAGLGPGTLPPAQAKRGSDAQRIQGSTDPLAELCFQGIQRHRRGGSVDRRP
jgi:hypothetical protein